MKQFGYNGLKFSIHKTVIRTGHEKIYYFLIRNTIFQMLGATSQIDKCVSQVYRVSNFISCVFLIASFNCRKCDVFKNLRHNGLRNLRLFFV